MRPRGKDAARAPKNLTDFLRELTAEINQNGQVRGLFAYEIGTVPVRELVASIAEKKPQAVWVFVGGEGGFSSAEVQMFEASGFKSATLGRQVLRVETACVALVSILKYELGLMR